MELGLAVNDYNAGVVNTLEEVVRLTLEYLESVKEEYARKAISQEELNDYFALVGQSWASVQAKVSPLKENGEPLSADSKKPNKSQ
jgi:hypothetical protein